MLATTIYLQLGLGWSALKAGPVNIPFAVVCAAMAGVAATVLMPRIGRTVRVVGALVLAAGAVVTAVAADGATRATSYWAFVPGLAIVGAGFGLMVAPIGPLALGRVDVRHAGAAYGQFNTTGQLANAVGAAAMGTLLFEAISPSGSRVPAEAFGHGYLVVLGAVALLMIPAALASRAIPADAHEFADPAAH